MIDCKTDDFFSKSVKRSVKCGAKCTSLLFDCSLVLEYAKIWTVLQSKSMIVSDDKFIDSKWSLRVKLGNQ